MKNVVAPFVIKHLFFKCRRNKPLSIFCFYFVLQLLFPGKILFAQETAPNIAVTNMYNEQRTVYNNDTFLHTSWKPIVFTDTMRPASSGKWFHRKFFQEHLVQVKQPGFNLNADIIFDEYIGKSKRYVETPMMNTRGYEVSGNISDKFYFETSFYENQGRFGGYVDSFIRKSKVIPGQNGYKNVGDGQGFDFSYSSSKLVYVPSKHFLFDLGYGKNFIGDGYRSVLLSDFSYNYPYFRTALTWGKFQYNMMWSHYISERNSAYNNKEGYFRKWAQTFLVDWKVSDRLTASLFETVMWPDQDSMRQKDMSPWIASPIIFLHGKTSPSGVENNSITGINLKFRLLKKTHLYGQFALDKKGSNQSWESRYAAQIGIRSGDVLGIKNLGGMMEFNTARPYTYATNSFNTNYAHNNQPLAHALGANFREGLLMAQYSYKKWWFRFETFIAEYGGDSTTVVNYGRNIFKPLDTHTVTDNATTGQGFSTNIFYADARIAYILNPATNMRIETGFTFRNEKSSAFLFQDRIIYIGIRMSFRKISYDF